MEPLAFSCISIYVTPAYSKESPSLFKIIFAPPSNMAVDPDNEMIVRDTINF